MEWAQRVVKGRAQGALGLETQFLRRGHNAGGAQAATGGSHGGEQWIAGKEGPSPTRH